MTTVPAGAWGGKRVWTNTAFVLLVAFGVPACDRSKAHQITIGEGPTVTRFQVQSSLAEYVELPGIRNELRVIVAGYAAACETFVGPGDDEEAVTLVFVTPPDQRPSPGTFAWSGMPPEDEPIRQAYVLPKALLGKRSRLFEPGGSVRLRHVQLEPHGGVSGTLALEFPGTADRPATRIDGGFDATFCRLSLAPR